MAGYGTQNGRTAWAQGIVTPRKETIEVGRNRVGPTDQVVKEIRALREFRKWKFKPLAERYGLTLCQIRGIVNYSTAAFVIHSEADIP